MESASLQAEVEGEAARALDSREADDARDARSVAPDDVATVSLSGEAEVLVVGATLAQVVHVRAQDVILVGAGAHDDGGVGQYEDGADGAEEFHCGDGRHLAPTD